MAQNASPPPPDDWNFDDALDFLQAFAVLPAPTHGSEASRTLPILDFDPSLYDPKVSRPASLGDFDRLWNFLGVTVDTTPLLRDRHGSTESSSSAISNGSTVLPAAQESFSSTSPASEDFDEFVSKGKEVRWKDEVSGLKISESQRRTRHSSREDIDMFELGMLLADDSKAIPAGSMGTGKKPGDNQYPVHSDHTSKHALMTLKSGKQLGLIPSMVSPLPPSYPPLPVSYLDGRLIQPLLTLTATEKKAVLVRMMRRKKLLSQSFDATMAVVRRGGNISVGGIHVFVDLSNINIGFFERLKMMRGRKRGDWAKIPPISFHSLAFILERNRPVARRIVAGSHGAQDVYGQHQRRPEHMLEAERCGYEMNILEPVIKMKSNTPRRKSKNGTGNGYATTSGQSSGSDAPIFGKLGRQEQCVDEILQMKMLESLVDFEKPSTLVLASGDGAEAEYSGGFLKVVERFLKKGWKVELFAWSDGLSMDYRSNAFLKKWEGNFQIIELDDFSEVLLALYAQTYR